MSNSYVGKRKMSHEESTIMVVSTASHAREDRGAINDYLIVVDRSAIFTQAHNAKTGDLPRRNITGSATCKSMARR